MSKLWFLYMQIFVVVVVVLSTHSCTAKTCIHYGFEYEDGKKIPTENPCLICKCRKGEVQCDPPKKCPKVDGCPAPVVQPGECCPRCVCQDAEGKTYERFQNWSYVKGETCYECECERNSVAKCKEMKCKEKSCPEGFNGVEMAGLCCPVCTKSLPPTRPPPRKFNSWEELHQFILAGNLTLRVLN